MKEIRISVRNKIAMNLNNDTYVCDNSDYKVVFDFDAEWEEHQIKTARFKYNGQYQEVVFTGSVCDMPVIRDSRLIYIGVYAGNLQTSTPAVVHASQSILSGDAVHDAPAEDVYNQLVALVESGVLQGPGGKSAYELAVENGYIGSETDWLASLHGAPGKTPVFGVDYGTPEQIAGIAQHAAGILADDIKKISDGKVDKVAGKGLSANDYDAAAKKKVDAIPENPKYTDTVTIVDASLTKDGDAADAKVTGEKLNRLKDDLANYVKLNFSFDSSDFSIGHINGQGIASINPQRIYAGKNYNAKTYSFPFPLKVICENGYQIRAVTLNDDETVSELIVKTEHEFLANEKFRISIKLIDETNAPDVLESDIPYIVNSVLLYTPIQSYINSLGVSLEEETNARIENDNFLKNKIDNSTPISIEDCIYTKVDGKYILSNGSINSGNNIFYTSLIDIHSGETLDVKSEMPNNGAYAIVSRWADENTFAETLFAPKNTGLQTFSYTAETDIKIRLCGVPYLTLNAKITKENTENLTKIKDAVIGDNFKKELSPLYGVKWDTLGDSLTASGTLGYSGNYTDIIADANGMNLNNVAVGGRSWWNGIITDEVPNIRTDTDIVTIFGSFNTVNMCFANIGTKDDEASASGSFCARVKNIFNSIYAIKNDVKIGVILPTPWVNFNTYDTDEGTQTQIEEYLKALTDVCHMYSIPVLDLYHESMMRPWDETFRNTYYKQVYDSETQTYTGGDGVHPNTLGHKLYVAPRIEQFLKSMCSNY